MIFLEKTIEGQSSFSTKKKYFDGIYSYRGEDAGEKLFARTCVGFQGEGGSLTSGPAAERATADGAEVSFPVEMKRVYVYRYRSGDSHEEILFAYGADGKLYRLETDGSATASGIAFSSPPEGMFYMTTDREERFLFAGKEGAYLFSGSENAFAQLASVPSSSCAAVHYERLFLSNEESDCKITFSRALDVNDFTENVQGAGYIEIPEDKGKILRLIGYDGRLYLIRERGITRLRAMGDNRNFYVSALDVSCGNIVKESVAVCGGYVVFLTDEGIYRFDGTKAERMCGELFALLKKGDFGIPCAHGEKYYAGVVLKDGTKASLCIDASEKEGYLLPFHGDSFFSFSDKLYFFEGADLYYVREREEGDAYDCLWESGPTDFFLGGKRKILKDLFIRAEGKYSVVVSDESRSFGANAEGSVLLHPRLCGRTFNVKICGSNATLYGLEATVDEY